MICKYSSGKERPCVPDYNEYRFGFIEKNRIEGFSHIGASSAKTQTERIAALFGLSEFQEFVKGFSNTIDEKYLSTTPVVQEQYKQALQTENNLKEQINTLKKEIIPIANELEVLIKKNGDGKISSYEETEKLLSDPEDGLIIRQIKECNENKKQIVESEDIIDLLKQIKSIISFLEDIQNSNSEILSDAKSINLSELYKAIIKVEKTDKSNINPATNNGLFSSVSKFPYSSNEIVIIILSPSYLLIICSNLNSITTILYTQISFSSYFTICSTISISDKINLISLAKYISVE